MTNDMPTPQRVEATAEKERVTVAEPSMFDAPEWLSGETAPAASGVKFAGVRFQRVGKVYHYIADGFDLKVGAWVIVDTARGRQMGQVASLKPPRDRNNLDQFKRIERVATGRDMVMRHYYENKELEAMIACRAESNALGLPIKIVKAEYSFDGQTLTFLFSSDQEERVETNDLRQAMSRLYRARIETRQVSPREVAKIIGGMGACGIEQRCCSRFLTDFSPISIKHAKEQGLSLNPHDITGMCGRLRCCLIYEYEQYVEARRHLPKKNAIVGTPSGQGKVVEVLPMRDSVAVLVGEGEGAKEIVVHREQIVPLEELKRLQDKAASGTCDKHEGGNCDCGKDKTAAAAAPATEPAVAETTAPEVAVPAGERQPRPEGSAVKKHNKKKKAPSQPQPQQGAANAAPQKVGEKAQGQGQAHQRHAQRTRHPHPARNNEQPPTERPQQDANQEQQKSQRRPLRRPLQRRP
jgi:cell fate regulator YaaT (PSP1 superfamily)